MRVELRGLGLFQGFLFQLGLMKRSVHRPLEWRGVEMHFCRRPCQGRQSRSLLQRVHRQMATAHFAPTAAQHPHLQTCDDVAVATY